MRGNALAMLEQQPLITPVTAPAGGDAKAFRPPVTGSIEQDVALFAHHLRETSVRQKTIHVAT